MKHFVYKTTNTINGHFYIGVHSTNDMNDGYIGSGKILKHAVAKHGEENFVREILSFHRTRKEAFDEERRLVTETLTNSAQCYNIRQGGDGGFDHINSNPQVKKEMTLKAKETASKWSEEYRLAVNAKKVNVGQKNGMYGRDRSGPNNPRFGCIVSDDTRKKISESNKGKIPSEEARLNMSRAQKRIWTAEAREKRSQYYKSIGHKPPSVCGGTFWWCNENGETLRSKDHPGEGWLRGRKWPTQP